MEIVGGLGILLNKLFTINGYLRCYLTKTLKLFKGKFTVIVGSSVKY